MYNFFKKTEKAWAVQDTIFTAKSESNTLGKTIVTVVTGKELE
jgi:hypothetical protein